MLTKKKKKNTVTTQHISDMKTVQMLLHNLHLIKIQEVICSSSKFNLSGARCGGSDQLKTFTLI